MTFDGMVSENAGVRIDYSSFGFATLFETVASKSIIQLARFVNC